VFSILEVKTLKLTLSDCTAQAAPSRGSSRGIRRMAFLIHHGLRRRHCAGHSRLEDLDLDVAILRRRHSVRLFLMSRGKNVLGYAV
jgi:hypothetical protein